MGTTEKYTSKIIKAGALVADTKLLLAHWDKRISVNENMALAKQQNIFGKASRTRIENILTIFKQRYLQDADARNALVKLTRSNISETSLKYIYYFHATRSDLLLHDIVVHHLVDLRRRGRLSISVEDIINFLSIWNNENRMSSRWGENTLRRVAQGIASTLRDFGVLEGANNKRLATIQLPLTTFAYIAFFLHREQPSGHKLLLHEDWNLFLLSTESVEKLFIEAHQQGYLEYYAAGSTVRITFPAATLEDYVDAII